MNRPLLLAFVLADDEADTHFVLQEAARRTASVVAVAPTFDVHPLPTAFGQVRHPMDYLSEEDTRSIYDSLLHWQQDLPGVRIERGVSVYDLTARDSDPPVVWSWLLRIIPPLHLRIRLIETVTRVLETETPDFVAIVGDDRAFPWVRELTRRVIETKFSGVTLLPEPTPMLERVRVALRERIEGRKRNGALEGREDVANAPATRVDVTDRRVRRLFRHWGLDDPETLVPPERIALRGDHLQFETIGGDALLRADGPFPERATVRFRLDLRAGAGGAFVMSLRTGSCAETLLVSAEKIELLSTGVSVDNRWGRKLDMAFTVAEGHAAVSIAGEDVLISHAVAATTERALYLGHRHRGIDRLVTAVRVDEVTEAPAPSWAPGTDRPRTLAESDLPVRGPLRRLSDDSARDRAIESIGESWGVTGECAEMGDAPDLLETSGSWTVLETRRDYMFGALSPFPRTRPVKLGLRLDRPPEDGEFVIAISNGSVSDIISIRSTETSLASSTSTIPHDSEDEVRISATVTRRTIKLKSGDHVITSDSSSTHSVENFLFVGHLHDGDSRAASRFKIGFSVQPAPRTHGIWRYLRSYRNKPRRSQRARRMRAPSYTPAPLSSDTGRGAPFRRTAPPDLRRSSLARLREAHGTPRHRGADHAVVILRGRKGAKWTRDLETGRWLLWDEYIENVPEALIAACVQQGWGCTIVYEGQAPEFDEQRLPYAVRYPGVVAELATADYKGLFAHERGALRSQYRQVYRRLKSSELFRRHFSHTGVGFFDGIESHLANDVARLSAHHATQKRGWSDILGVLDPNLAIAGRFEVKPYICQAAHDHGTLTSSVKLGVGEEMLPSVVMRRPDGTHDAYSAPDVLLMWGEKQASYLRRRLPELSSSVAVSGRTRNDAFTPVLDGEVLGDIRRRLGVDEDARMIVFGGTCRTMYGRSPNAPWGTCCLSPGTFIDAVAALADLTSSDTRTWLLVKPHPADNLDFVGQVVAEFDHPRVRLVTSRMGFHNSEILAASDVFVSSVSSMFAEAAMAGCPSVNLWTPDVAFLYEPERLETYSQLAITARTVQHMKLEVERLLSDSRAHEAELNRAIGNLADIFGATDGHNAERAVQLTFDAERTRRTRVETGE